MEAVVAASAGQAWTALGGRARGQVAGGRLGARSLTRTTVQTQVPTQAAERTDNSRRGDDTKTGQRTSGTSGKQSSLICAYAYTQSPKSEDLGEPLSSVWLPPRRRGSGWTRGRRTQGSCRLPSNLGRAADGSRRTCQCEGAGGSSSIYTCKAPNQATSDNLAGWGPAVPAATVTMTARDHGRTPASILHCPVAPEPEPSYHDRATMATDPQSARYSLGPHAYHITSTKQGPIPAEREESRSAHSRSHNCVYGSRGGYNQRPAHPWGAGAFMSAPAAGEHHMRVDASSGSRVPAVPCHKGVRDVVRGGRQGGRGGPTAIGLSGETGETGPGPAPTRPRKLCIPCSLTAEHAMLCTPYVRGPDSLVGRRTLMVATPSAAAHPKVPASKFQRYGSVRVVRAMTLRMLRRAPTPTPCETRDSSASSADSECVRRSPRPVTRGACAAQPGPRSSSLFPILNNPGICVPPNRPEGGWLQPLRNESEAYVKSQDRGTHLTPRTARRVPPCSNIKHYRARDDPAHGTTTRRGSARRDGSITRVGRGGAGQRRTCLVAGGWGWSDRPALRGARLDAFGMTSRYRTCAGGRLGASANTTTTPPRQGGITRCGIYIDLKTPGHACTVRGGRRAGSRWQQQQPQRGTRRGRARYPCKRFAMRTRGGEGAGGGTLWQMEPRQMTGGLVRGRVPPTAQRTRGQFELGSVHAGGHGTSLGQPSSGGRRRSDSEDGWPVGTVQVGTWKRATAHGRLERGQERRLAGLESGGRVGHVQCTAAQSRRLGEVLGSWPDGADGRTGRKGGRVGKTRTGGRKAEREQGGVQWSLPLLLLLSLFPGGRMPRKEKRRGCAEIAKWEREKEGRRELGLGEGEGPEQEASALSSAAFGGTRSSKHEG
ncbi:hypothetical protein C8Q78DRAFT_987214 [Trametes maxima]|nr:hypothetical protein C8Q78DRAFT_987214 [Trametes maxima]